MKPQSTVLIIAGSDSSGGAGIQADIKTVTALGSYAMTAITAVTAQNTTGVSSIISISPKDIFKQITFTCSDIKPNVIKIGMLHSPAVIKSVIKALDVVKVNKIILDPVMIAKGGAKLINPQAIKILKLELIKKAFLITPNIPEAEVLTNLKIRNEEEMIIAAYKLLKLGAKNVLIKGGHLKSNTIKDILVNKKKVKIFKNKKIKTKNTHGTGCTLSSAIATSLSQKKNMVKSCKISLRYVDDAIISAPGYGRGFGPLNHLVSFNLKNTNA